MERKTALTAEEIAILAKLSVEQLRILQGIAENGKEFPVLYDLINFFIDTEKNYIFSINETISSEELVRKHAYSRGQAAFGIRLLRLLKGAKTELARREKIQKELRGKQGENNHG